MTDKQQMGWPEPNGHWWRFSFAYYIAFAALGATALAYGFLSVALAILCLITGLVGALCAGLRMFSRWPIRRIVQPEDVSRPTPQWLIASSVLLFVALGVALALANVGVVGFVVATLVASLGVTGVFAVMGWRRGKARRR